MPVDAAQEARAEVAGYEARVADEIDRPRPVDEADAEFQRAPPLHAHAIRTLIEPCCDLLDCGPRIPHVARDAIRPPKHDHLVMAAGFPHELAVARGGEIAVIDPRREPHRRGHAMLVVAVPVYRQADAAVVQVEETQPPIRDGVRLRHQPLAPRGQRLPYIAPPFRPHPATWRIPRPRLRLPVGRDRAKPKPSLPQRQKPAVSQIAQRSPQPPSDLGGRHAAETTGVPG
jgi:hypothetical protein